MTISLDEVLPAFDANGRHVASVADWSAAVDDPADQSELRTALETAIAALPAASRAIIFLHDVEGVPMAEVAESLAITVASARHARPGRGYFFASGSTRLPGIARFCGIIGIGVTSSGDSALSRVQAPQKGGGAKPFVRRMP